MPAIKTKSVTMKVSDGTELQAYIGQPEGRAGNARLSGGGHLE